MPVVTGLWTNQTELLLEERSARSTNAFFSSSPGSRSMPRVLFVRFVGVHWHPKDPCTIAKPSFSVEITTFFCLHANALLVALLWSANALLSKVYVGCAPPIHSIRNCKHFFHPPCFACTVCGRKLDSLILAPHTAEPRCPEHHQFPPTHPDRLPTCLACRQPFASRDHPLVASGRLLRDFVSVSFSHKM